MDTNNLNAGSYNYNVSDINGCSSSGSVSINQPNPLTEISNSTDVSCNGGSDGTAEIISIAVELYHIQQIGLVLTLQLYLLEIILIKF